jgi:hypothetical protein
MPYTISLKRRKKEPEMRNTRRCRTLSALKEKKGTGNVQNVVMLYTISPKRRKEEPEMPNMPYTISPRRRIEEPEMSNTWRCRTLSSITEEKRNQKCPTRGDAVHYQP